MGNTPVKPIPNPADPHSNEGENPALQSPNPRQSAPQDESGTLGFFLQLLLMIGKVLGLVGGDDEGPGQEGGFFGMIKSMLSGLFGGGNQQNQGNSSGQPAPSAHDARPVDTSNSSEKAQRQKEIAISGLTDISSVSFTHPQTNQPEDMAKVASELKLMPDVTFYNDRTGKFDSFTGNSGEDLQRFMADHSSGRVRTQVEAGENGQPEYMYFTQSRQAPRSGTGFTAATWIRTDESGQQSLGLDGSVLPAGKVDLYYTFPGYGKDFTQVANDQSGQAVTLRGIADGGLCQQAPEVIRYIDASITDIGGAQNLHAAVAGDHSMGIANACAAEKFLEAKNVPTKLYSFESAGGSLEAKMVMWALQNDTPLRAEMLQHGVTPEQIMKLRSDFSANSSEIRSAIMENGDVTRLSDVALLHVGIGLMPGYMEFLSKTQSGQGLDKAGEGNAMIAGRQEYINATNELSGVDANDKGVALHRLALLHEGLLHGDEVRAVGQALSDSNIAAVQHNGQAPTQPSAVVAAAAQSQEQGRAGD